MMSGISGSTEGAAGVPYLSASDFFKKLFGCKVYRLALDAGCTCPTRDGTKGTRGCIFCSARGSGDFAGNPDESIACQLEKARELVAAKAHGRSGTAPCRYIAYFQNFTSTYGDTAVLAAKFREAAAQPDVAGISIATRPDCLSDEMLAEIAALDTDFISIELGLQTSRPESSLFIRRGYDNSCYQDAVRRIRAASKRIHVVTHVIFGLPGETEEDMLETVRWCTAPSDWQTDGIKFTVLHVLEGTDLADCWRKGDVRCLEMEEYFSVLKKALGLLPPGTVVHRLTGDGPKKLLLAPLWTADKKRVHNALMKYLSQ